MAASYSATIIHTLGGSILDNLFWHINTEGTNIKEAQQSCVEGQLKTACKCKVISHAYAEFTGKSILEGDKVGKDLPYNTPVMDAYIEAKKAGSYTRST
jgi:hypothetical protein